MILKEYSWSSVKGDNNLVVFGSVDPFLDIGYIRYIENMKFIKFTYEFNFFDNEFFYHNNFSYQVDWGMGYCSKEYVYCDSVLIALE